MRGIFKVTRDAIKVLRDVSLNNGIELSWKHPLTADGQKHS